MGLPLGTLSGEKESAMLGDAIGSTLRGGQILAGGELSYESGESPGGAPPAVARASASSALLIICILPAR